MLPIRMEAAALYGSTDGFSGSSGFQQKVGLGSFHGMYLKKSVIGRTRRVRFGRRVASSRSVCRSLRVISVLLIRIRSSRI